MSLKILEITDKCTGCGACVSICPKSALTMEDKGDGFYYPHLDSALCIDCKACEKVCHAITLMIPEQPSRQYSAYMCKAYDKELVRKSSSGGVFSVLANYVLKLGGTVYGARYNYEKERLEHCSTDECALDELRKSKYIESYSGHVFKQVGDSLKDGRNVLFCGTPCQLVGLSQYLQQRKISDDKLIRVRFICHGVPANKFFLEYKHFEEKRFGARMTRFDFRPKINGWASSDWLMEFENGKTSKGSYSFYYYYYIFQLNLLLRECCYRCGHLKHEITDFTIADFWGISSYNPEHKEKEGLSLVMTHSAKARKLIQILQPLCEVKELPLSATDYIYKDAIAKESILKERNQMMNQVVRSGYMNVVRKKLRFKILNNKIRAFCYKYLHFAH